MPLITLQSVSKAFGPQQVLREITLEVRAGETLVLIGESGCGKSVTMKLMMDLLQPSAGHVLWDDMSLRDRTERQITQERLRFGYLFQQAALFDSLTVFENVAFGLRQNKPMAEAQIREIVHHRLQDVGLDPRVVVDKKPAELSGGMRKRVGLARALALSPEVMLYDEPTTGLDPIMSDVINELIIRTARREQMTSVVVTHDMTTVRKVADRVVMFYPLDRLDSLEPQIIFEGTAGEAFECDDPRVHQFVHGEAGQRLLELAAG
jgi:phospholipid/cholesterol/gamma-HCH transport system ATP-binding protein